MANQLGMTEPQSILVLAKRGWSYRRIARPLGIRPRVDQGLRPWTRQGKGQRPKEQSITESPTRNETRWS